MNQIGDPNLLVRDATGYGYVMAKEFSMASGGTPMAANATKKQRVVTVPLVGSPEGVEIPLAVILGATATITYVAAGCANAICTGDATITLDVKKNGTTILDDPIELSSTDVLFIPTVGTITDSSGAEGDVYTVEITTSVGTGELGSGVFVTLGYDEDPV